MKKIFYLFIFFVSFMNQVNCAEAGMPQLDPEYGVSQSFWLIISFGLIYFLVSKIFIPKIKGNIDAREDKIRKDLEEAKHLKEEAEIKLTDYKKLIEKAKIDNKKILAENRQKLNQDILIKKSELKKTLELEIKNAEKDIVKFKNNSKQKIIFMSEEITSKILKDIFNEDLNVSSIKAAVDEVAKNERLN